MNKFTRLILGSTLTMLSACTLAAGTVVLDNQHSTQQWRLENMSTLLQVVTDPGLPQDIWWPGAVITLEPAGHKVEQDKKNILARLAACQTDASPKQAAMLQSVIDQIQKINAVDRLFTPLDPETIRTTLTGGDVSLQGEYKLYTGKRPTTLMIMGAVSHPGPVMWQPATPISDYLDKQQRLSGADRSTVTLIHPDGQTTTVPVAYWNNLNQEASPGSIVWVGFTPCATDAAGKSLQDDIISLLTRRVPE
ncbi:capsule biosynthesis GfcC family protein [uncultured Cedecea sp.]|uniref:capsule biosynthesis GfcC family protein n=1 Tax=uncultured Cedecea sp. TaxID=988762 RepID=UPI002629BC3E|nr:capsule biosynthesis GfcC family protein [uncultured Cedecea sp.]